MRATNLSIAPVLALALACREPTVPPGYGLQLQDTYVPPGVQFTAALGSDTAVFVVAHNNSNQLVSFYYGACAFAVRMFGGTGYTVQTWQSVPSGSFACIDIAYLAQVPASDSLRLLAARMRASALVDPPPLKGQVRAYASVNGQMLEMVAGIRDVAVPQP